MEYVPLLRLKFAREIKVIHLIRQICSWFALDMLYDVNVNRCTEIVVFSVCLSEMQSAVDLSTIADSSLDRSRSYYYLGYVSVIIDRSDRRGLNSACMY